MVRSRPRQFIPLVARLRNLRPDVPDPARAISAGEVLAEGRVVTNLERTNVADLDDRLVPAEVEVVTMDLSYLPVALAAPQLEQVRIHPCADLIALVKPMYELGRRTAPHSRADLGEACRRAADGVEATGWSVDRVDGVIPSPVPGARGAHEFLLHARRRPSP